MDDTESEVNSLTADDLVLLCDLFYLPFEHGSRGLRLLHDFHWLTMHAAGTLPRGAERAKPEVMFSLIGLVVLSLSPGVTL